MTDSEIKSAILDMGRRARAASYALVKLSSEQKNTILVAMADEIMARQDAILAANALDLARAEQNGLSKAMIDRLTLDPKRLKAVADAVREVALLPDPVGEKLTDWTRPNGLHIRKVRVPIGVIGIIFESRPNVTTDAASLCFKTGNATILRGGSEAIDSNRALAAALQAGGERAGLPPDSIQLIPFTDRASVEHMARMDQYIDLIIPHQANVRIVDAIRERLGLPPEKAFLNLQKYGNTSGAAIAIALDEASREGRLKKGDNVLLVAFGAGFAWAASVIRW